MTRFKPLLLVAAVVAAAATLIRSRITESTPVDSGGWKPVEPT
ncbi:MAG TPA: hypothetical protein VHL52_09420 [Acidimicrobiia bacterium]|nr:hypothetical protein [Acidimicrobiia bacterium]